MNSDGMNFDLDLLVADQERTPKELGYGTSRTESNLYFLAMLLMTCFLSVGYYHANNIGVLIFIFGILGVVLSIPLFFIVRAIVHTLKLYFLKPLFLIVFFTLASGISSFIVTFLEGLNYTLSASDLGIFCGIFGFFCLLIFAIIWSGWHERGFMLALTFVFVGISVAVFFASLSAPLTCLIFLTSITLALLLSCMTYYIYNGASFFVLISFYYIVMPFAALFIVCSDDSCDCDAGFDREATFQPDHRKKKGN